MKYGIRILHNNQRDLSTCVYFQSGEKIYMFNFGDGIQRIASQAKMKFGKVRSLFIPSLLPDHFLGLPGFYLTARDGIRASGNPFSFTVHGPEGFSDKLKDCSYIMGTLEGCGGVYEHAEEMKEFDDSCHQDPVLCVDVHQTNYFQDETVRVETTCNQGKNGGKILSYFVVPKQTRGKFLPQVAKKLG